MLIDSADLTDHIASGVTVCIVGSGAAGMTLACELDGAPYKVLLVEAGGFKPTPQTQDYYRGEATHPHPSADEYRRVAFGGTTSVWGGRCVPFDPIDFERRDYLANSGWPIGYREVAEYYPRALEYCDAGTFDFTASGSLERAGEIISGLDGGGVLDLDLIERYSLPTDFGKRYREKIRRSMNITAVLHARCTELTKAPGDDRIAAVEVVLASGIRKSISANIVVLALGGVESTRMLLASDHSGNGFGNRYDRLGRFYACHLESTFGKLVPHGAAVAFNFERTREGVYCRRQIRFSATAQRENRLLNTAFRLHFPEYSDASHGSSVMSSIYLAKSFLIAEYRSILQQGAEFAVFSPNAAHWRNVLRGVPQLFGFGFDWIFLRHLAERKLPYTLVPNADGSFPLEFNCEQTPLESSRITLSNDTDIHGMKRVRIDWRRSEDDIATIQRAFALLRRTFEGSGSCRLEFDDEQLLRRVSRAAPLGGHHLGTTRMAANAKEGVVDTNCAVFDLPNLYVASSAVFPTGGHANPTLTIVALAVRLARHLRSRCEA
jgi:choline dehydrogenase-like flavoprotein